MSFSYKNPTSGVVLSSPDSLAIQSAFGTNFSVSSIGGYMEVWYLNDLSYSTYGGVGNITNSGNTIPIQFYKSPNPAISDRVQLWSDGISSGRRRIGMLVYVHENETTYQYNIPDYETLWDAAVSENAITTANTSYSIFNKVGGVFKPAGQALITAWTGSTIEGIGGITKNVANWRIFPVDVFVTGGTYFSGSSTLELYNNTGGTIAITGFSSNNLTISDGTTTVYNITGITFSGLTVIDNGNGSVTVSGETGSGTSGTSGTSGSSGTSGTSGSSGSSGTSGSSGISPSYCGTTVNCIILPLPECSPTPTNTTTPTLTQTPTNTPTETPTPTLTQTPTNTETPTNTPTNTETPTNTPTNTETPTPTLTQTPTNTETPTNTPTHTKTPTPTPVPLGQCVEIVNSDGVSRDFQYLNVFGVLVCGGTLGPSGNIDDSAIICISAGTITQVRSFNSSDGTCSGGMVPGPGKTLTGNNCYDGGDCLVVTPTPTATATASSLAP